MKSAFYFVLELCSVFLHINYAKCGHVLVAGNEAAFRTLAKKFEPQRLAAQLASIVSGTNDGGDAAKAQEQGIMQQGEEYYDNPPFESKAQADSPDAAYDGQADPKPDGAKVEEYEEQVDYGPEVERLPAAEVDQQQQRAESALKYGSLPGSIVNKIMQSTTSTTKRVRTMQVNLDELVEKVRLRLLKDFQTSTTSTAATTTAPNNFRMKRITENENRQQNPDYEQQENVEKMTNQQLPSVATEEPLINRPKNAPTLVTQKKKAFKILEAHGLYEKVKLNKKTDSYEDYVTPQKEVNPYVSGERGNDDNENNDDKTAKNYNPNKKFQRPRNVATTKEYQNRNKQMDHKDIVNFEKHYDETTKKNKNNNDYDYKSNKNDNDKINHKRPDNDYDDKNNKNKGSNDYENSNSQNKGYNNEGNNNSKNKGYDDYGNANSKNKEHNDGGNNNNKKKGYDDYGNTNTKNKGYNDYGSSNNKNKGYSDDGNNNNNKNKGYDDYGNIKIKNKNKDQDYDSNRDKYKDDPPKNKKPSKNYGANIDFSYENYHDDKKHSNRDRDRDKTDSDKRTRETTPNISNNKSVYVKNSNKGSKYDMTYNDYNEATRTTRNSKASTVKDRNAAKPEYADEDYPTAAASAGEPKAMTEFIGGPDYNYKDDLPATHSTEKTTEQHGYVNTKRKYKQIATNMAVRQRFTISTPNYYEKLPRIAEKYNFDEPIPEKDREAENLKPIAVSHKAAINGKIKVV